MLESLALITVVLGVLSVICHIIVIIDVFKEEGLFWGIFGLLCCQLYVFYYGWTKWKSKWQWPVMGVWTIGVLSNVIYRYYARSQGYDV